MKKITELKVKQRQNLNLLDFVKGAYDDLDFLISAPKLSVNESIDFYSNILYFKSTKIKTIETQNIQLINDKVDGFIRKLPEDDSLFIVSFSQYETFFDDNEYYNVSPLPVFKLKKINIKKIHDYFFKNSLYFFSVMSPKHKLVMDSYSGDTTSLNPDIPTYEYYEEIN